MSNEKIFSSEMGYKIEINAENNGGNIFKVYMPDGSLISNIDSIHDLIQNKYLSASKANELRKMAEDIFSEDLNRIQEIYYSYEDNDNHYFDNIFQGINMVCKLSNNINNDIKGKIKNEISELLLTEFNKNFPIYIEGNRINIVFSVNPHSYLKAFKNMHNNIFRDGNYSFIKQSLELGEAIDKMNIVALKILDIVEKY
jgi:hypothetical protein